MAELTPGPTILLIALAVASCGQAPLPARHKTEFYYTGRNPCEREKDEDIQEPLDGGAVEGYSPPVRNEPEQFGPPTWTSPAAHFGVGSGITLDEPGVQHAHGQPDGEADAD